MLFSTPKTCVTDQVMISSGKKQLDYLFHNALRTWRIFNKSKFHFTNQNLDFHSSLHVKKLPLESDEILAKFGLPLQIFHENFIFGLSLFQKTFSFSRFTFFFPYSALKIWFSFTWVFQKCIRAISNQKFLRIYNSAFIIPWPIIIKT